MGMKVLDQLGLLLKSVFLEATAAAATAHLQCLVGTVVRFQLELHH